MNPGANERAGGASKSPPPEAQPLTGSQMCRAPLRAATDRREMGALHGGGGEVLSGMSVRDLLGTWKDHRLRREEGPLISQPSSHRRCSMS